MQPSIDRPHWDEVLDALEDIDFCEDGETTIARDGAITIPGVFYITVDGQETTVEENEVPQILLQAREQGARMKRSSLLQLKLRTRCARCRKIGHWARECPEGGIEDNATTKGTIDVQESLNTAQRGSSP